MFEFARFACLPAWLAGWLVPSVVVFAQVKCGAVDKYSAASHLVLSAERSHLPVRGYAAYLASL